MRALVLLALLGVAACRARGPSEPPPTTMPVAPADAIVKVTENGPVKATVKVWPSAPSLDQPLFLELSVAAEPGALVQVPEQAVFGRFRVERQPSDERTEGDRRVTVRTYELQALASGKHRLPPLRVEVTDTRASASGSGSAASPPTTELLTEEVPVDIAPIPGATADASLRGGRGVLDAEVGRRPMWAVIIPSVLGGLLALALLLAARLRARRQVRAQVSAYDAAVSSLAQLQARGAPDEGAVDAWFVELSMIVRRYLEGRYDIRAPELTTEEFLVVAQRAPELTPAHRDLLGAFMRTADQVKFAGLRPSAEQCVEALRSARGFVEDTRRLAGPAGSPARPEARAA
jgi:hypothetical protein